VEVVFQFSNDERHFGFQLRADKQRVAHQGMLDILRDAFNYDWRVTTDFEIEEDKKNGKSIRVWLTK
jgi:hypothetical protein